MDCNGLEGEIDQSVRSRDEVINRQRRNRSICRSKIRCGIQDQPGSIKGGFQIEE